MNDYTTAMDDANVVLFDTFGEDATVQRGTDAPLPVRVFVERGVQKFGDYGPIGARVTTVTFIRLQYVPQVGDLLVYSNGSRKVAAIDIDDGFVVTAVLNG